MFVVKGRPVPKGRPRHNGRVTYTPKRTLDYEKRVAEAFKKSNERVFMNGEPVFADIRFYFKIPKNATKKEVARIKAAPHYNKKVDLDNLEKAILDGLNGVAFADDSQVVEKYSVKWYDIKGDGERVEISIKKAW